MAGAIVTGAIDAGAVDPAQVGVVDPDPAKRAQFATAFANAGDGVEWLGSDGDEDGGVVVLAVKPQMLGEAVEPVRNALGQAGLWPLVISILAGIKAQQVHQALGGQARVVRVMPNTPAAISMGMSAISSGPEATATDIELVEMLLGAVGQTIGIEESLMDAFTGLAGSGPAYVFYVAEAMARGAIAAGFSKDQAQMIVRQTIAGSGMLLARSGQCPAELRGQVTSKGGTTAAGVGVLDDAGVMDAITRAVIAARDRGVELGRG